MNRHDIFWKVAIRIRATYRDHVKGEEAYAYSEDAARELQDAGLLAPDLPTLRDDYDSISVPIRRTSIRNREHDDFPILYENEDSVLVGVTEGGEVEFSLGMCDEVFVTLTTDQARQFAHTLLGVTDHAERKTND